MTAIKGDEAGFLLRGGGRIDEAKALARESREYLMSQVRQDPRLADARLGADWIPTMLTALDA
jgi:hypothetical protein